jgi:restriction system protein
MATKQREQGAQFLNYFGPLLDALRSLGGSGTPDEVFTRIARDMHLSDELQNELLPSGQSRYHNQVGWARYHLVQEGLVSKSKHGVWSLTELGQKTHLTLQQAREIRKRLVRIYFEKRKGRSDQSKLVLEPEPDGEDAGPTEGSHRAAVLGIMQELPAAGFEKLCQRILREAGFQEVVVTGRSGDRVHEGSLSVQTIQGFGDTLAGSGFPRSYGGPS